ncbi:uncharacterized protein LOC144103724 [Amblyomma americanum]
MFCGRARMQLFLCAAPKKRISFPPAFKMTATDVIRELGDPDKLCGLEDHIVLKFTEPWQPSRMTASAELPTGLHFEDGGLRITATAESFVKNCGIICQRRVVAALFAGCAELRSCGPLACAARKVLSSAETLVIVHNRDYVVNLVDWFRSVEVLVLHHDLKRQALPEGWKMPEGPSLPQLKRLIGNTPGLGLGNLYMLPATIYALACGCPQLYEVQTSMHEVLDPMITLLDTMLTLNPPLLTSPSLVLGMCMERLDGRTFTPRACDITPFLMTRARENFRGVRRLELYEVQTPMHHVLDLDDIVLTMTLMTDPCLRTSSSLVLGRIIYRLDGRTTANPLDEVTPGVMVRASSFFPEYGVWRYPRGTWTNSSKYHTADLDATIVICVLGITLFSSSCQEFFLAVLSSQTLQFWRFVIKFSVCSFWC